MQTIDHYSTLGVLPDAEDIVIKAAYRALAQRYHPDRWEGEPAAIHSRMASINEAYAVLGDRNRRAEYDNARSNEVRAAFAQDTLDQENAFDSALGELAGRWSTACTLFPEIDGLRTHLAKISTGLSFSFVTTLLETQAFRESRELAEHLEGAFLKRYFGTDPRILNFAKALISEGQRAALRRLNQFVEVAGSDVEASLLITKVEEEFGLQELFQHRQRNIEINRRIDRLRKQLRYGDFHDAKTMAELLNYKVETTDRGIFRGYNVSLLQSDREIQKFDSQSAFVAWVAKNL